MRVCDRLGDGDDVDRVPEADGASSLILLQTSRGPGGCCFVGSKASSFTPPGQPVAPIVVQVDFEYDNRNRLTRETRDTVNNVVDIDLGPAAYDLSYTYDAGGNRLTKTDLLSGRITTYVYDIETDNAIDNNQHNNRLLGYDITEPGSVNPVPVEKTLYKYGPAGNIMLLVKQLDMDGNGVIDQNDLAAVWWFYYDAGNKLWLAVQGTAVFTEATGALSGVTYDKAAEYRYDGGRQRYLVRQRDPNNGFAIIGTGQWRDYAGNNIYNDYTVDVDPTNGTPTVTNGTGHLPSIGFDDPSMADSPAYIGSDLIGTTRRVSDSSAGVSPVVHRSVLTAFGERISSVGTGNTRYGYAGEWGYETPDQSFDPLTELGWLHVGARYYDPAIGRFMQRDPIGIRGGFNVYVYVDSTPTVDVDPSGLSSLWPNEGRIRYGPSRPRGTATKRIGFRVGKGLHLFGARGALAFGGSCAGAAGIGYGTGILINIAVKKATGQRLSDRIGDALFRLCPSCFSIGL